MSVCRIIFYISVFLVFYSYVLYPMLLSWLMLFQRRKKKPVHDVDAYPLVSILMAAYNEEKVIRKKIDSIIDLDYPKDKLEVWIGSDASTDGTDEIVLQYAEKYSYIKLIRFSGRSGKSRIINSLKEYAGGEILISTDANVIFSRRLVKELVAYFSFPKVGMVAANVIRSMNKMEGMQVVEKKYIRRENSIKLKQWLLSGIILGAEGGCYAIRRKLFTEVPPGFFMDDFFITMHVIQQGYQVAFSSSALCYEDIPSESEEEFKRKTRISIGNYQNMMFYRKLLFNPFHKIFFHFISHKFLRWMTPYLLLLATVLSWFLALRSHDFFYISLGITVFMVLPFAGRIVFRIPLVRFAAHFMYMNYALLWGFYLYLNNPSDNIWKPTERNV